MKTPVSPAAQCWLLPRICDTAHLRFDGKCAAVHTNVPLPPDACFISGHPNGCPVLQDVCFSPQAHGCGSALHATLCLPVALCFACGREHITCTGTIRIEIQAMLRAPCTAPMQIFPQPDLRLRCAYFQNGCLYAEFDLRLCLYAVQLQPAQLSVLSPELPQPDCTPFFHLPIYPQLPTNLCRAGS